MNTTNPPPYAHLRVAHVKGVCCAQIEHPETRNALTAEIVAELGRVVDAVEADPGARALVLRGAGGFFCSGGNIGGFGGPPPAGAAVDGDGDPVAARNREFGHFMQRLAELPVPVVALVEGGAFGGGMGLACAADLVLATADAKFALSETTLGLIPAQIGPFVVARLGAVATRRLGLSGERVAGEAARSLGLVDDLAADAERLDELAAQWLTRIGGCGPRANRALKRLVADCASATPIGAVLDEAARSFARCLRDEGLEGASAFLARRAPPWRTEFGADELRAAFGRPASA